MSIKGPYKRKSYQSDVTRRSLIQDEIKGNQIPLGNVLEIRPDFKGNVKWPEGTAYVGICRYVGDYRTCVFCLPSVTGRSLGLKELDNKLLKRITR